MYKDDKKNGKGVFEWSDGKKYIGNWVNGMLNISNIVENREIEWYWYLLSAK